MRSAGRVSAVHYVFIGMSNELGAAESGLAASLVGTVPAIVGGGAVAIVVVGIVALRWRALVDDAAARSSSSPRTRSLRVG